MLTYIVSLESSAGTFPIFSSDDGPAAQRTAVALSQEHPAALITTTPVDFLEMSLIEASLLVMPSPLAPGQPDGLIEVLASAHSDAVNAEPSLDLHFWPEQVTFPVPPFANYSADISRTVPLPA